MRKIILASTSPHRKEMLEKAGLIFDVVPSDYEEDMTLDLEPGELAKFLSKGKAETVAKDFEDAIIISADTFVSFENKIIGKPHTIEKAYETLRTLSGKTHSVFTGFTIIDTREKKMISKAVETKVSFKELSNKMINDYILNGNPLRYAGSYTLNEIADKFIEKIEGDRLSIIGLPINTVMETLKEFNIDV
jgi:septum formation protein